MFNIFKKKTVPETLPARKDDTLPLRSKLEFFTKSDNVDTKNSDVDFTVINTSDILFIQGDIKAGNSFSKDYIKCVIAYYFAGDLKFMEGNVLSEVIADKFTVLKTVVDKNNEYNTLLIRPETICSINSRVETENIIGRRVYSIDIWNGKELFNFKITKESYNYLTKEVR